MLNTLVTLILNVWPVAVVYLADEFFGSSFHVHKELVLAVSLLHLPVLLLFGITRLTKSARVAVLATSLIAQGWLMPFIDWLIAAA